MSKFSASMKAKNKSKGKNAKTAKSESAFHCITSIVFYATVYTNSPYQACLTQSAWSADI